MNEIDRHLSIFLNGLAQRTLWLDRVLAFIGEEQVLKGGVLVMLLCWAWFTTKGDTARNRPLVIVSVLGASTAALISRGLTHVLPYRPRPLWDPTLGLVRPPTVLPEFLEKWSSLPSDHASLFVGLSFGLMKISPRVGRFALVYATIVALFPRLYLGLHYLSDLLAGALVGIVMVVIFGLPMVRTYTVRPALAWHERSPGSFYAFAFLAGHQIVQLFGDLRVFLVLIGSAARHVWQMVR